MTSDLYKTAYAAASAVLEKKAGWASNLFVKWPGLVAMGGWALPIAMGALGGVGAGYAIHKATRRADPTVSDSNSVDDLRNVEHLKRVKYYKQLIQSMGGTGEEA